MQVKEEGTFGTWVEGGTFVTSQRYAARGRDLGMSCQHGGGLDPLLSPRGRGWGVGVWWRRAQSDSRR